MTRTLYKYLCPIGTRELVIDMPAGAELHSLQLQYQGLNVDVPALWMRVAAAEPCVPRRFRWRLVEQPDGAHERLVGTVRLYDGLLTCHLFELVAPAPTTPVT